MLIVRKKKRRTKFHDNAKKQVRRDMYSSQEAILERQNEISHECGLLDVSIAKFPPQPRVIAIGDIHGDFQALVTCLRDCAQVADYDWETNSWKWVGGNTYVVLVGDMVDRYRQNHTVMDEHGLGPGESEDDELAIITLVNWLKIQAVKQGGNVLKCFGNHEIENMNGNFSSVTPKYVQSGKRQQEWQIGGVSRTALFECGVYGVVQIGQWVFCHGGISRSLIDSLREAAQDQNIIDFIHQELTLKYNDGKKSELQESLTKRLYNAQKGVHRDKNESFVWNDGFSNKLNLDQETCNELEENLNLLGENDEDDLMRPKYLVVGHRQQPETEAEKLGWSLIKDFSKFDQGRRQVFEYIPNSGDHFEKSSEIQTLRINGDCNRPDTQHPSVWRIDASISRSFTPKTKKFPAPQVLEILFDSEMGQYLPPRVLVSTVPRFFKPHHHNAK